MITVYRKEKSYHGHSLDELKSGLQKYIRRSMFERALYCAADLDMFKQAEGGGRIYTNFIHRLYIILLEDVANISIIPECVSLIKSARDADDSSVNISRVVALMCHSPKARICSHARAFFTYKENNTLDDLCASFRDRMKHKDVEAIRLAFGIHASEEKLKKKYKRRANPQWFIFSVLCELDASYLVYEVLYEELKQTRESFLCWLLPLLHYLQVVPLGEVPVVMNHEGDEWKRHKAQVPIFMDDFVYDKHTRKGDKSRARFIQVGAVVDPEATFIVPEWKAFYEGKTPAHECKQQTPEIVHVPKHEGTYEEKTFVSARETEYTFIVRAQLVTRRSGQDTYFAVSPEGKNVFVKGPFNNDEQLKGLLTLNEWKKRHQMPFIEVRIVYLLPDRWPEGTPLGLRNSIQRDVPQPFMVCDSIVSEYPTLSKSSKLWPATDVLNGASTYCMRFDTLNDCELEGYILFLLMRYVFGIGDLADRNFLVKDGILYSIDEESRGIHVSFQTHFADQKRKKIACWLQQKYDKQIYPRVSTWTFTKTEGGDARKAIEIQNKEACIQLFQ